MQQSYKQIELEEYGKKPFKIKNKIRLIELFGGIGSQAMALRDIGADFEHWKLAEWEVNATASYKAIHHSENDFDYSSFLCADELPELLYDLGISTDGKKPLTLEQIKRLGETKQREIYNNFQATRNIGSVVNRKGKDLEIVDVDKYTYILTYSFPCQDLSVAGKQKGMKKGSGTRSGLLWEVERLLNEVENLPQVLLMENVPQVASAANIEDFNAWRDFLVSKGYTNFTQMLNAKDYGVAQNRNRCFMVSILGDFNYEFPQPKPLEKTMNEYLEDEVDEKYYIKSEKTAQMIEELIESGMIDRQTDRQSTYRLTDQERLNGQIALRQQKEEYQTTRQKVTVLLKEQGTKLHKVTDIACTLCARDYKGFGNQEGNGVIEKWR